MIDTGLKNKIVLITGVNNPHGIGAATARAFAAEGAAVFATYLRLPAEANTTDVPGEAFYRAQNAKGADEVIAVVQLGGEFRVCNRQAPARQNQAQGSGHPKDTQLITAESDVNK